MISLAVISGLAIGVFFYKQELEKVKLEVEKSKQEIQREVTTKPKEENNEAQKKIAELEQKIKELEKRQKILSQSSSVSTQKVRGFTSWILATARIFCLDRSFTQQSLYNWIEGSGTIWKVNNQYWLVTNRHIIEEAVNRIGPYNILCFAFIVTDPLLVTEDLDKAYELGKYLIYQIDLQKAKTFYESAADFYFVPLIEVIFKEGAQIKPSPLNQLDNIAIIPNTKICNHNYSMNASVKILGYPAIGSTHPIITITEGIISSFEREGKVTYYLTSAKIDEGNSGGAAIASDDNCFMGIPTFVKIGVAESMGRILALNEDDIYYFLSQIK